MSPLAGVHGGYVHPRRCRVLAGHLARLLPRDARVLDVGCGDGLVAHLVAGLRPDLSLSGVDVLVRPRTHVPVAPFDGRVLPYDDASFDAVMLVDVLHHCHLPEAMLAQAARVARRAVVVKDHLLRGVLAGPTLRLMDRVGNARHGVELPNNYWSRQSWLEVCERLGLEIASWEGRLGLYPWPASWVFGRSLHFVARLEIRGGATA